jgi:hypothetical protein
MEDVSQFHIADEPSHLILSQACLGVLLCLDDSTNKDNIKQLPLYWYATRYQFAHSKVGNVKLQIKDAMDCFFDTDKPHFAAFIRLAVIPRKSRLFGASPEEERTGMLVCYPQQLLCLSLFCGDSVV